MLVQFRHVQFNETFSFPINTKESHIYFKTSHQRGKRGDIKDDHKSPLFQYFKKSEIVLIGDNPTTETKWMEVKKGGK